jgi:Icc-related predicted phosphoesterase
VIIDCISDLHGHYPELPGGDLLIVAGDLTARDSAEEHVLFQIWLHNQNYKNKVVIAGNHDNRLCKLPFQGIKRQYEEMGEIYLCDSGTEFEYEEPVRNLFDPDDKSLIYRKKLKIWGSPWTKTFPGMNPCCKAFTVDTEEELAEKWKFIPDDVDILVTHSPPKGVLDSINNYANGQIERAGSLSLLKRSTSLTRLKLFVFGHIHEGYGILDTQRARGDLKGVFPDPVCKSFPFIVNASHVNERYEPVNKPIRIEL